MNNTFNLASRPVIPRPTEYFVLETVFGHQAWAGLITAAACSSAVRTRFLESSNFEVRMGLRTAPLQIRRGEPLHARFAHSPGAELHQNPIGRTRSVSSPSGEDLRREYRRMAVSIGGSPNSWRFDQGFFAGEPAFLLRIGRNRTTRPRLGRQAPLEAQCLSVDPFIAVPFHAVAGH